jgi:hypothetical protein
MRRVLIRLSLFPLESSPRRRPPATGRHEIPWLHPGTTAEPPGRHRRYHSGGCHRQSAVRLGEGRWKSLQLGHTVTVGVISHKGRPFATAEARNVPQLSRAYESRWRHTSRRSFVVTIPLSATDGPLFESCDTGEDGSGVNVAGRRALAPATQNCIRRPLYQNVGSGG